MLNQAPYSLKSADYDSRRFEFAGSFTEIKQSLHGLPNIRDFDILIYLTSWLQNACLAACRTWSTENFKKINGLALI
jgi:hypothetical protein